MTTLDTSDAVNSLFNTMVYAMSMMIVLVAVMQIMSQTLTASFQMLSVEDSYSRMQVIKPRLWVSLLTPPEEAEEASKRERKS